MIALALANPLISQGNKAFPGSVGVSGRFSLDSNLRIAGEITKKHETECISAQRKREGEGLKSTEPDWLS